MTLWRYPNARILVFARAPEPGRVKTRLQPLLGEQTCLRLYRELLHSVIATVQSANLAPMQLWVDRNPDHEEFTTLCDRGSIHEQLGADLGERMSHALHTALSQPGVDSAVLIGSDCPAMGAEHLEAALGRMQGVGEAVISPASDGGYVLIGVRGFVPDVFSHVKWGEASVYAQTLQRFAQSDALLHVLPELWDVDRPEDLGRLVELDPGQYSFINDVLSRV